MDALTLLTADHNRVRGLFTRFQGAHSADDGPQLVELATKIVEELEVHAEIEEQLFYPAVREASEELREAVAEGLEEHHVARTLLDEAKGLSPDDEAWVAKLLVLIESVEHHAGEEEQEMFPAVRKALGGEALEELGVRLEGMKARLGAPTVADKEQLSTTELQELAKEQQVPGRSSMSREELLATVAPS
ncbi:MAG TPA: hemerythrin domain-containing protein [Acidimicrobiales bacterium]|nr:hemerythrin domain-containing protein [Acidimicrobiales bacterium]